MRPAGVIFALLSLGLSLPVPAAGRTPCADFDSLRRPFFGDLHVHTA